MRTKMIALAVVAAAALGMCGWALGYINMCMDDADDLCSRAALRMEEMDPDGAIEALTILAEKWEAWSDLLEIATDHMDLQSVTESIISAKICAEQQDYEEFSRQAALLQTAIHHLRDEEEVRLSNVL